MSELYDFLQEHLDNIAELSLLDWFEDCIDYGVELHIGMVFVCCRVELGLDA